MLPICGQGIFFFKSNYTSFHFPELHDNTQNSGEILHQALHHKTAATTQKLDFLKRIKLL